MTYALAAALDLVVEQMKEGHIIRANASKPTREERRDDERHAEAFCELETNLRDCPRMGEIAAEWMLNAKVEDDSLARSRFVADPLPSTGRFTGPRTTENTLWIQ